MVATSFFVDTATNVYEYVAAIKNALRTSTTNDDDCGIESGGKGGSESEGKGRNGRESVWINVGPVQWHTNAQLRPTVDEFRDLIEAAGFVIQHWEVSEDLVGYRHPDDAAGSFLDLLGLTRGSL